MERMFSQGAVGNTVPLGNLSGTTPGLVGDVYLNEDYRNATFLLYENDNIAKDYPAKLDLQRNEFDVKVGTGIKSLAGGLVKSLAWKKNSTGSTEYFVNGKEYTNEENAPYLGFFQILTEGDLTLLKMTELIFKKAERVGAHSVGSQDNKFIKKPKLYLASGKKAYELPSKKGIRKLFESRAAEMEEYMKMNEIDLKKESHLINTFEHYNSLVKK